jgi:serine beta-lactamase-like protein LACTB
MRRIPVVLILLGFISPAAAQPQRYAAAIERIDRLVSHELESKRLPAVAVALVDDQTIVWSKGFGFADPEKKIPATADTVFRVGSVSKLFTDIAVMKLVEAGKLDLDAPVTKYLPDFRPKNPFNTPITLRHLMTHRAGFVREPPVGNYFDNVSTDLGKMVESLNQTTLLYAPGTKIKYSNAGVAVVGYVLQKTQGQPFAKYVKESVLDTLGMKSSGFEPTPDVQKNLAKAIMWTPGGREFPAPTFELGMAPAACMYSTVTDLALFLRALSNDGTTSTLPILKRDTLEQMWKPQFAAAGAKTGIGLGFFVDEHKGRRVGHNGAMYGFATELAYLPEEKLGVVVAISCDCANSVARNLANFAVDSLLAVKHNSPAPNWEPPKPIPVDMAKKLSGQFLQPDGTLNELYERDGRLWVRPYRGNVFAELKQRGNVLVTDDRISENFRIGTEVELLRSRSTKNGPRFPRKPADIPEKWAGLIGEYGPDYNILKILERDGQLYALIEWFFVYPLVEESVDVFKFPSFGFYHDEKIRFTRDTNGKATKAVAAEVTFKRRAISGEGGGTFQIKPIRQMDGLRKEALAAEPPKEAGDFRKPDLVDLTTLDKTIKLDIRYASDNNFLGTPFYTSARAFMQRPAAEAVARVHKKLAAQGFGLLFHDAYRPWYVTKMFWEATPEAFHQFVADPSKGSRHNRGCAVDLTLYDLKTGKPIQMPGGYDEFSDRSYPDYPGGTSLQRWHRDLLRSAMEAEGFTVYEAEWWHFDYKDWRQYPIMTRTFEELGK